MNITWTVEQDLYLIEKRYGDPEFKWRQLHNDKNLLFRCYTSCNERHQLITRNRDYMNQLINDSGWSLNENERLEELAQQTSYQWSKLSEELKKEPDACKRQWCLLQAVRVNHASLLSPSTEATPIANSWSKEQDLYLIEKRHGEFKFSWSALNNDPKLLLRSASACNRRYQKITTDSDYMHKLLNESGWSESENERLEELARQTNNEWSKLSEELKKEPDACKNQWCLLQAVHGNHISPVLPLTEATPITYTWSKEQELYLIEIRHGEFNFTWNSLKNDPYLSCRSPNACRIRYNKITTDRDTLQKFLNESGWSVSENKFLEELAGQTNNEWSVISEELKKEPDACKKQWCLLQAIRVHHASLLPFITNTWSKQQDLYLIEKKFGDPQFKWEDLENDQNLSGRSSEDCRTRYHKITTDRNTMHQLLNDSGWTLDDNWNLELLAPQTNKQWSELSKVLKKDPYACKKQWCLLQAVRVNHANLLGAPTHSWSKEQDLYLIERRHGDPEFNWSQLHNDLRLSSCPNKSCRMRYYSIIKDLDTMQKYLNDSGWSINENKRLEELAGQTNCEWNVISEKLKKEPAACKKQWCLLQAIRVHHASLLEAQAAKMWSCLLQAAEMHLNTSSTVVEKTLGKRAFDSLTEEFQPT